MTPNPLPMCEAGLFGVQEGFSKLNLLKSSHATSMVSATPPLVDKLSDSKDKALDPSAIQKSDVSIGEDDMAGYATSTGADSGYGSLASTPNTTKGRIDHTEFSKVRLRAPGLKYFDKPISAELRNRFFDLKMLYSEDLWKEVSKKKSNPGDIAMKLKYLGDDEATSRLYIVVHCEKRVSKSVKKFFAQAHVLEELRDDFRVYVINTGVLRLFSSSAVEVYRGSWPRSTLCGMPIEVRSNKASAMATLGGLVMVWGATGTSMYGITAGHALIAIQENPSDGRSSTMEDESDDDDGDEDSGEEESVSDFINLPAPEQMAHDRDDGPFTHQALRNFGTIQHDSVQSNSSIKGQNRDWALVSTTAEEWLPNSVGRGPRASSLRLASADQQAMLGGSTGDFTLDCFCVSERAPLVSSEQVVVISYRGLQRGTLTANKSSILLRPGTSFVEALDFVPDAKSKLQPGDSGAWVVDELTGEVYGHVVSADAFGEAYVMPIQDTLRDVQRHLRALYVSLPSRGVVQVHREMQSKPSHEAGSASPAGPAVSPVLASAPGATLKDKTRRAAPDSDETGYAQPSEPQHQRVVDTSTVRAKSLCPEAQTFYPTGGTSEGGKTQGKLGQMRRVLEKIFRRNKAKPVAPPPTTEAPPAVPAAPPYHFAPPPLFQQAMLVCQSPAHPPIGCYSGTYAGMEKYQYPGAAGTDSGYASMASSATPSPSGSQSSQVKGKRRCTNQ
ncbi:hypothetical protein DL766_000466 [Monosporascus sp. MC13-8B]|uniref:Uncharacterized protein n=1 Tax=Monosporascus cannonballus TaxID=155416 RepID=A0ABY0HDH1_9PEZI|nr:hypothetical protein DL762_002429 [Monosporascus cannonballus]RYP00188.1 hypothetical protein DL763_000957 [Monosporascus cannonballus]RYP39314.1 hypothetical protein DL766_000466 [Monosporascus sp. MC13-8B]